MQIKSNIVSNIVVTLEIFQMNSKILSNLAVTEKILSN